jgi:hypothetical protein
MIDVNKITSTLAKLPDQQLQQYAQMHKSDPYIMALAMSESNRRKEMRVAGQGAQGMQDQPKVVDQMVAEMAPQQMPEDMGIGQLPAGEMNFASGGIVAFADGGDVERYSGEFGSFVDSIDPLTGTFYMPDAPPDPASMRRVRVSPYTTPQQTAEETALLQRFPKTPVKPRVDAAPKVDTGRKAPGAGLGTAAAKKETGFDALLKSLEGAAEPASTDSPFSQKIKDMTNARVQARKEDAEGLDAIHRQFSDIFKGREERLSKREGELGKMKDQSMGLALLQAGAAIMSTPGSLGTAIGRGVDVGSKQYVAGMDKLNAAKEKLSDARDRLDDLNAQRGEMSAREKLKAMSAIKTEEAAGLELLLKADMDMHKISREEALKRLDLRTRIGIAQLQEQGQNFRSAQQVAAANRTPAEIQMVERIMKEKNIPFSEALASLTATKREPVSQEKLRGDWLDPAKRMQIAQDYPNVKTFDDYMTVMGADTGGGAGGFRVVGVR